MNNSMFIKPTNAVSSQKSLREEKKKFIVLHSLRVEKLVDLLRQHYKYDRILIDAEYYNLSKLITLNVKVENDYIPARFDLELRSIADDMLRKHIGCLLACFVLAGIEKQIRLYHGTYEGNPFEKEGLGCSAINEAIDRWATLIYPDIKSFSQEEKNWLKELLIRALQVRERAGFDLQKIPFATLSKSFINELKTAKTL